MRSFDAKNCIVNISIGEFALDDMDDGVPYLPEASISDEVLSLRVAESALLIVWWDWGGGNGRDARLLFSPAGTGVCRLFARGQFAFR